MALLVLAAVMLRAATPAGWMPNPQGATGAPFVICTGTGSQLLELDGQGKPTTPESGKHRELCAFAGHHSAPAPTPDLDSDRVTFVSFTAQPAARSAPRAAAIRHREQSPRAPPTTV
ncbi:DUF2946 family protein [Phenylobacterium sp.]|uniref:DUF2946 family protein n=1 Tax=Phenylobacterium sp. TaxID=1871053 RepID=UPI0025E92B33|nr:DUF2946 family protein [Phenylobacterium sp.]